MPSGRKPRTASSAAVHQRPESVTRRAYNPDAAASARTAAVPSRPCSPPRGTCSSRLFVASTRVALLTKGSAVGGITGSGFARSSSASSCIALASASRARSSATSACSASRRSRSTLADRTCPAATPKSHSTPGIRAGIDTSSIGRASATESCSLERASLGATGAPSAGTGIPANPRPPATRSTQAVVSTMAPPPLGMDDGRGSRRTTCSGGRRAADRRSSPSRSAVRAAACRTSCSSLSSVASSTMLSNPRPSTHRRPFGAGFVASNAGASRVTTEMRRPAWPSSSTTARNTVSSPASSSAGFRPPSSRRSAAAVPCSVIPAPAGRSDPRGP